MAKFKITVTIIYSNGDQATPRVLETNDDSDFYYFLMKLLSVTEVNYSPSEFRQEFINDTCVCKFLTQQFHLETRVEL